MFSPQKWGEKAGNAVLNNSGILFPGFCRIPAALGGVELLLDGYGMFEEAVDALEVDTAVSHVLDGTGKVGKVGKQSWNSRIFLTSPLIPGNLKFEVFSTVGSWEKPHFGRPEIPAESSQIPASSHPGCCCVFQPGIPEIPTPIPAGVFHGVNGSLALLLPALHVRLGKKHMD